MADYSLQPETFDGTDIQSTTYRSWFAHKDDPLRLVAREPVEVEVAGDYAFPTSPRSQPESRILPLHIEVGPSQTALNNLKKLFDPFKGDVTLTATDSDANTWQLTVRTIDLIYDKPPNMFVARLYVARPIWESSTLHSDAETASTTPHTWNPTPTPVGTVRCYPTIEVKPTVAKSHDNGYIRRWQVIIAWRSELPGVSSDGLAYPIDIANDSLDTAAEIAASRMQADGDDLRVLVDGVEIDRWLDGINTSTTKVWCNISFQPRRQAGLKANMTDVSPANGEWFDVVTWDNTLGWDDEGYFVIDDECFHYTDRETTQFKLSSTDGRGARGTTAAAHTASSGLKKIYWVEHQIDIVSDYTAAANPPAAADIKPVIDLANSTNAVHKYPGTVFTGAATLRTGQFLRRYTNDNLLSPAISLIEEGGGIKFRDVAPSAAALQYNNLELAVPCGVKAAAAAITHDVTVQDLVGLQVLGVDLEGMLTTLARYDSNNDGAAVTIQPGSVLSRLIYRANPTIITGAFTDDSRHEQILATKWKAQQFVLDAAEQVWRFLVRLKKVVTTDGDVTVWIAEHDTDAEAPGGRISPLFTIAHADIGTSYGNHILHWTTVASDYGVIGPGTFWLCMERAGTGGEIYWSTIDSKIYPRGTFYQEADTGQTSSTKSPGTMADDASSGGNITWSNPDNAKIQNDTYAQATGSTEPQQTHYLKASNFGFAIPTNAIIEGVKVRIDLFGNSNQLIDWYVQLVKGGAIQGNNKAVTTGSFPITDTDTYREYGDETDMWGLDFSPEQINSANFGVVYSGQYTGGAGTCSWSVDHIEVIVYYRLGGTSPEITAHFAIMGRVPATAQAEAPSGSAHETLLDDIEITFDTNRTPTIVRSAQQTIYWLQGTLKNDGTSQEIALSAVVPLNTTVSIDCLNHTVTRDDTGESIPGAITPSDLEPWMHWAPGTVAMRYTETGIGTVVITPKWRDAFG